MQNWQELPDQNNQIQIFDTIYIKFSQEITKENTDSLINIITTILARNKINNLYFLFSSPWWNVNDWIDLHNFLKAIPVNVIMHNTWSIDSIANIIFLAWNERYACPDTSFLFHWVSITLMNTQRFNLNQIKEIQSSMETDQKKIAWIISNNSKLKKEDIEQFFNIWKSIYSEEALEKGLISKIKNVEIIWDAPLLNFVSSYNS